MENVSINPSKLKGEVRIPASKSLCHRAVICAGLSVGESNVYNVTFSKDIEATCEAMKKISVNVENDFDSLKVIGNKYKVIDENIIIDCNESGSTLRFMIPIVAALGIKTTFEGRGKLVERPMKTYYDIFDIQNIKYSNSNGNLPLSIEGNLNSGDFMVDGNISSQFISGLLFSLPLLHGTSRIILTSDLESKPYIDLTIDVLKKFGIVILNNDYREFIIEGEQKYRATNYTVEGDFSQGAFWLAAGVLGARVTCTNLKVNSIQGDRAIIDIIKKLGGRINCEDDKIWAASSKTTGEILDVSDCPDLVPILTVIAALSEGTTQIVNAGRLRFKESDRLKAICRELNILGANIEEKDEGLVIIGKSQLKGGIVDSWNDHRIAMALAIASIKCSEPIIIKNSDCVKKSYPDFWKHFKELGGEVNEWSMGE
jgi:3-phosphoshikimate 1-carboxyvinyltransferase